MTAWMIMMIIAAGPLVALADGFGDDTADDFEDDGLEETQVKGPAEEEPVAEDPLVEDPLVEDPATEDPTAEDPAEAPQGAPLINDQTLTDADDTFEGTDDARQFIDLAGGDDTATGGRLSDIIQGGDGADTINGGGGADLLYASGDNAATGSDTDADELNGEGGSDFLYFGNDDIATGGSGGDEFTLRQDLSGNATITDFDVTSDSIVFETDNIETLSITSQTPGDNALIITLSNGATLTLAGITDPVADTQITFEQVPGLG